MFAVKAKPEWKCWNGWIKHVSIHRLATWLSFAEKSSRPDSAWLSSRLGPARLGTTSFGARLGSSCLGLGLGSKLNSTRFSFGSGLWSGWADKKVLIYWRVRAKKSTVHFFWGLNPTLSRLACEAHEPQIYSSRFSQRRLNRFYQT